MSTSVNKVIIVGNLGFDPEVRYMPSGIAVVTLSVATTEHWKDKNNEQQERTEWHRTVIFGKFAEICSKYLKKGSKVYIEGSLRTRKWQDKSGNDRYTTEIVVADLCMLDRNNGGNLGNSRIKDEMEQGADNSKQKGNFEDPFVNDPTDDAPF